MKFLCMIFVTCFYLRTIFVRNDKHELIKSNLILTCYYIWSIWFGHCSKSDDPKWTGVVAVDNEKRH